MNKLLTRTFSLILASTLLFSGCTAPGQSAPGAAQSSAVTRDIGLKPGDSREFNDFLMELFAKQVTSNTLDFHYCVEHPENYGLSMEDVTFGTVSLDTQDEDLKDTEALLKELQEFDRKELSDTQLFIYEMLEENLKDSLDSFDFTLYQTIFSPTTGIQAQLPVLLSEYEFRKPEDIDDYILLLEDTQNYFTQLLAFEKAKSEAGLFMADFTADAIIGQCEEFIKNPEENLLIDIFEDKLNTEMPQLTKEQQQEYMERNTSAVLHTVIPAYKMIIDELTALKGTGTNDAGMAHFKNGKQYYTLLAKGATGSSKSVEEMIEIADTAMSQDLTLISLLYTKDMELLEKITQAKPLVTEPEEILNTLQEAILTDFPEPVSKEFTIKYVHESLQENLSPAFYLTPAIDAADSNTIYINEYHVNDDNLMSVFSTLAHEGYPGHLYEATYFNSTDPHPIRKLLNYSGYSEGWATYVEMQSFQWAGVEENVALALRANQDFSLAMCARVDMGVNYEGWSREETGAFLEQFGMNDEETLTWIFEAVIAEPANYLSYFIGYKEFEELRADAEDALDGSFDPVAFHEFLLTIGGAPFDMIEERMETWIDTMEEDAAKAA